MKDESVPVMKTHSYKNAEKECYRIEPIHFGQKEKCKLNILVQIEMIWRLFGSHQRGRCKI